MPYRKGMGTPQERSEAVGKALEPYIEWMHNSKLGEVCGIFGCVEKPVAQCSSCQCWYCEKHKAHLAIGHALTG
jgi:hypothetical protein